MRNRILSGTEPGLTTQLFFVELEQQLQSRHTRKPNFTVGKTAYRGITTETLYLRLVNLVVIQFTIILHLQHIYICVCVCVHVCSFDRLCGLVARVSG
jgi:hypothetical protein